MAQISGSHARKPLTLAIPDGRSWTIPDASPAAGVARASFAELCGVAVGPADYLTLAQSVSTLIVTDIPILTLEHRNEVRRFITLVDALYEHKVRLVAVAAAEPHRLFRPHWPTPEPSPLEKAASHFDEVFAFDRTVSRLIEMQSEEYLEKPWIGQGSFPTLEERRE